MLKKKSFDINNAFNMLENHEIRFENRCSSSEIVFKCFFALNMFRLRLFSSERWLVDLHEGGRWIERSFIMVSVEDKFEQNFLVRGEMKEMNLFYIGRI